MMMMQMQIDQSFWDRLKPPTNFGAKQSTQKKMRRSKVRSRFPKKMQKTNLNPKIVVIQLVLSFLIIFFLSFFWSLWPNFDGDIKVNSSGI